MIDHEILRQKVLDRLMQAGDALVAAQDEDTVGEIIVKVMFDVALWVDAKNDLEIGLLKSRVSELEIVLNQIADWDAGDKVTGRFDCPAHAQLARTVIKRKTK